MKKIVITQEQAVAIEERKIINMLDESVKCHIKYKWKGEINKSLNKLSLDEFIRALYIGYEVEPEFKAGDYVANRLGTVGKVAKVDGDFLHGKWLYEDGDSTTEFPIAMNINYTNGVRHATPDEIEHIATEKSRRWWERHDRDVHEIKQGDILMGKHRELYEVTADPMSHRFGFYTGNDEHDFDIEEFKRDNWEVVCFMEDRKDIDATS